MNTNIENVIRAELERMGIQQDDDEQQETQPQQEAPPRVSVEAVLSNAIGGPLALNADQALGRIAGGARATVNGKPLNY